jgi:hypothetical protein
VTVTRGSSGGTTIGNKIAASGTVRITNGGSAPATIGNVVVNLQRRVRTKWISVAAAVADATNGDAATSAKILASASQEDPDLNAPPTGPGNYTVSGLVGTFTETAGSGSLKFFDTSNNPVSLVPQIVIQPGQTLNLRYNAGFNNTVLNIPAGASVRVEFIVTFGNAGPRGGSGASAQCVDINGNGAVDADERYIRSVPFRVSLKTPAPEECLQVVLTDLFPTSGNSSTTNSDIKAEGAVTWTNATTNIGGGTGAELIDGRTMAPGTTITRTVTATVSNNSLSEGRIENCAHLDGFDAVTCAGCPDLDACDGVTVAAALALISGHVYCQTVDHPVPGVTVTIKDSNNNVIATATTGTDGSYSASVPIGGPYTVCADAARDVNQDGGNDVVIQSPTGGCYTGVVVPAGGVTGRDFVYTPTSVGDRVLQVLSSLPPNTVTLCGLARITNRTSVVPIADINYSELFTRPPGDYRIISGLPQWIRDLGVSEPIGVRLTQTLTTDTTTFNPNCPFKNLIGVEPVASSNNWIFRFTLIHPFDGPGTAFNYTPLGVSVTGRSGSLLTPVPPFLGTHFTESVSGLTLSVGSRVVIGPTVTNVAGVNLDTNQYGLYQVRQGGQVVTEFEFYSPASGNFEFYATGYYKTICGNMILFTYSPVVEDF